MATKHFWCKWEFKTWLGDTKLGRCAVSTRGVWIDLISAMMQDSTDRLSGTPEQLAQVCRCPVEAIMAAVGDLDANGAAEVHKHDGIITIINTKRKRELEIAEVRSKAGAKGGAKSQQSLKLFTDSSYSNSNSSVPVEGGVGEGEAHGGVPTRESAVEYARKIELPESEVDKFLDFYSANGWKVGKNAMKSWPHAMNNWKRNWKEWGNKGPTAAMAARPSPPPRPSSRREQWQIENDIKSVRSQMEKALKPDVYSFGDSYGSMKAEAEKGNQQAKEDLAVYLRLRERKLALESELRTL